LSIWSELKDYLERGVIAVVIASDGGNELISEFKVIHSILFLDLVSFLLFCRSFK